jgi:sporulation protein YlmC with PRC-barrel domain
MNERLLPARRYLDNRVQNASNIELGHVHDMVIDTTTGRIAYVVVRCGSIMRGNRKLVAVRFEDLHPAYGDNVLIWYVSAAQVGSMHDIQDRHAPG